MQGRVFLAPATCGMVVIMESTPDIVVGGTCHANFHDFSGRGWEQSILLEWLLPVAIIDVRY